MTPPGWHPDPGHSGKGPAQERWWDGAQWTGHVRPSPVAVRRRGIRIGVGVTVGALVLAAIGGGIYLLGEDDGGRPGTAASSPSATPSAPGGSGAPDGGNKDGGDEGGGNEGGDEENGGSGHPGEQMPPEEPGYATDLAAGISMPVPKGWTGKSAPIGAGLTTGEHPCPGGSSKTCVRGGVFSAPAVALKLTAGTPEEAAKKDIAVNAEESYGGDAYGKLTSHEELKSGPVTVAGRQGYAVRWKVVTEKGDDGYVESLVFPSPASKDMLVVVRSGFDINKDAPKLSVMDEIVRGIKAAPGAGAGNGGAA
ncbi:DUF2510 domain-containing protein [Streptomyces sp. NPDC012600]|uniref:DUF2510 domain-containing protein n=1 Tax=Streptomyces stephensoniae TaxID=3375367 RepID=A0ABU2WAA3_9ACTN|nr:DUF2510 domain-containing protein [Streptomyces griseus]MDT0494777.1 DUF2510 domain-containing protein [Streptomyces griseus]